MPPPRRRLDDQGDDVVDVHEGLPLLTAHDARRCARRMHNEWDPSTEKVAWEVPADLRARFDAGLAFEDAVLVKVATAYGADRCADLRGPGRRTDLIARTAAAAEERVDVVLGGWVPDDEDAGRTGRPELLVHVDGGRYVPGEVKGHTMLRCAKKGAALCADLGGLTDPTPREPAGIESVEVRPIDTAVAGNPNLDLLVDDAARTTVALLTEGKRVYLHCVAAQSWTPTVVARAAALLGHDTDEALRAVVDALPVARSQRFLVRSLRRLASGPVARPCSRRSSTNFTSTRMGTDV